jgi:ribosomal protein S10
MEVNRKIYAMKTFNVTITSRNKNSIYNFFLFFNQTTLCNLNGRIKYFQKSVKKRRLTVLKSPHVNKKAQEQFEYRLFKKQFTIQATKIFRYLVFLKKLNYNLFPDIHMKLKLAIRNKSMIKLGLKTFDPNYGKSHKFYSFKIAFFSQKNLR